MEGRLERCLKKKLIKRSDDLHITTITQTGFLVVKF